MSRNFTIIDVCCKIVILYFKTAIGVGFFLFYIILATTNSQPNGTILEMYEYYLERDFEFGTKFTGYFKFSNYGCCCCIVRND